MSKLWHDDIRPAPEGWMWARTNQEAVRLLLASTVRECSLDHDLGLHKIDPDYFFAQTPDEQHAIFLHYLSEETGYDLAKAMVSLRIVPPRVTIHSHNPSGALDMQKELLHAQEWDVIEVIIKEFPR